MAYTKSNWTVGETIDETRLDHAETQYDEVLADLAAGTFASIIAGSTLAAGAELKCGGSKIANSYGYITAPMNRMFAARKTGSAVTLSGLNNVAVFNTEDKDPNGVYDSGSGIFTAPVAGMYLISFNINCRANGEMKLGITLFKDSTIVSYLDYYKANVAGFLNSESGWGPGPAAVIVPLTAGQNVRVELADMKVMYSGGADIAFVSGSFAAHLLSAD